MTAPDFKNFPPLLRALPRWALYRIEWKPDPETGKFVPTETWVSYRTGQKCDPNAGNPRDWATFEEVRGALERWPGAFDGIGIALGQITDCKLPEGAS